MKPSSRSRQAPMTSRSRELRVLLERDVRVDRLAEELVRHADDRRLANARDRVERVLDLGRAHLLAARLDDVVAPPDEVEEPLRRRS